MPTRTLAVYLRVDRWRPSSSLQLLETLIMLPGAPSLTTPVTVTTPLGEGGDLVIGQVIQARLTIPGVMQWQLQINGVTFDGETYMKDNHRCVLVVDLGMMPPKDVITAPISLTHKISS